MVENRKKAKKNIVIVKAPNIGHGGYSVTKTHNRHGSSSNNITPKKRRIARKMIRTKVQTVITTAIARAIAKIFINIDDGSGHEGGKSSKTIDGEIGIKHEVDDDFDQNRSIQEPVSKRPRLLSPKREPMDLDDPIYHDDSKAQNDTMSIEDCEAMNIENLLEFLSDITSQSVIDWAEDNFVDCRDPDCTAFLEIEFKDNEKVSSNKTAKDNETAKGNKLKTADIE
jgi:hypothetical protein